ncbi:sister chromatid cohesion protein 1 [Rhodotorula kratochvilovae]
MFFNSDLLTKRGALAQVWMASHLSSKLSKQALTSTSIPKSVQSILGQELLPMALRLSGQLLLGIARIYSRKTKYLLDDAQETLHKVKKAFQNEGRAAVDLPEDGHGASGAGADDAARGNKDINLRREGGDLEDMLALEFADEDWSLEKHLAANAAKADKKGKGKALTANIADITLDESFAYDGVLGDNLDFGGLDDMGFDPDFALFDGDDELGALAGPSGEKASPNKKKRARGTDGGDEERDEGDLSVEMGRRDSLANASERNSIGPLDLSFGKDGAGDVTFGEGGDNDFGGFDHGGAFDLDLGLMDGAGAVDFHQDFGGGFDEEQREKTPTVAGDDSTSLQLTPRAAAEVAARQAAAEKEDKQPPKKRVKHVAADKVIELEWEAGRLEGKDRFKDPEYLPSSRLHLALLDTPSSALLPRALPKTSKSAPSLELFAPPGLLAPELQDLFAMPTRREQIRLEGRERKEDRAVEQGRRAMSVLSNVSHLRADGADFGLDAFGAADLHQEFGGGFDDADLGGFDHGRGFDLELDPLGAGEDPLATPKRPSKKRRTGDGGEFAADEEDLLATPARSVLSALACEELPQYHSEGPLAVFDDVASSSVGGARSVAGTATPSQSQSQLLSQSLGTEQERAAAEAESVVTQKSGSISLQSRNTRKAVRVLKEQLAADVDAEVPEERKVEFTQVAEKASRRAAASFFFELLVLSSADVVKLNQPSAYGEIEVRGTQKLQEIAV